MMRVYRMIDGLYRKRDDPVPDYVVSGQLKVRSVEEEILLLRLSYASSLAASAPAVLRALLQDNGGKKLA